MSRRLIPMTPMIPKDPATPARTANPAMDGVDPVAGKLGVCQNGEIADIHSGSFNTSPRKVGAIAKARSNQPSAERVHAQIANAVAGITSTAGIWLSAVRIDAATCEPSPSTAA